MKPMPHSGVAALAAAVALLAGGAAAAEPIPRPAPELRKATTTMNTDSVIAALAGHDAMVLREPPLADPAFFGRLEAELPKFDDPAKTLTAAYLTRYDNRAAADLLLALTRESVQVAAAAARSLNKLTVMPAAQSLLAQTAQTADKFVRGQLYLALGRTQPPPDIAKLRAAAAAEKNIDALSDLLVAVVKAGGDRERAIFLGRIRTATADQALTLQDQLLYVADPRFAKGLLPWLDSNDGVLRHGSDRQGGAMIRMKDLAVWIAHRLGVRLAPPPEFLGIYGEPVIDAARRAIKALPDP